MVRRIVEHKCYVRRRSWHVVKALGHGCFGVASKCSGGHIGDKNSITWAASWESRFAWMKINACMQHIHSTQLVAVLHWGHRAAHPDAGSTDWIQKILRMIDGLSWKIKTHYLSRLLFLTFFLTSRDFMIISYLLELFFMIR